MDLKVEIKQVENKKLNFEDTLCKRWVKSKGKNLTMPSYQELIKKIEECNSRIATLKLKKS